MSIQEQLIARVLSLERVIMHRVTHFRLTECNVMKITTNLSQLALLQLSVNFSHIVKDMFKIVIV